MKITYYILSLFATVILFSCSTDNEALIRYTLHSERQTTMLSLEECDRASGISHDILSEINTTPNNSDNQAKLSRLKALSYRMNAIDEQTGKMISMIDRIKIKLLTDCGEPMKFNPYNPNRILLVKNNPLYPVIPAQLNLSGIKSAGEVIDDVPVSKIQHDLQKLKQKLLQIMGTYSQGNKQWSIKPVEIASSKDAKELESKVEKMIRKSHANPLDEKALMAVYCLLTSPDEEEKYNDLPLITVIGNLSLLQNKVLTARSMAFAQMRSELNRMTDGLMFNEARVIAYGPDVVKRGEEMKLQIVVAAFETGAQHVESNLGKVSYERGVPVISLKPAVGKEIHVKGTLDLKNKSGVKRVYPWEKTIQVTD